jgi:signal transduction histidine kinase
MLFSTFWKTYDRRVAGYAAVLLAITEVAIDWSTWIQLNISIVYVLPLVLAAGSRSRRLLWSLATSLALTTIAVYYRQSSVGGFPFSDPYLVNRLLSISNIFIGAALLHVLVGALDELDKRGLEARDESGRKTRFLASISHDLRTPLTTISLIGDLIQRTAGRPEQADQHRQLALDLQASCSSLSSLVENAFDVAQIDAGRLVLHESDFPLDRLLAEECRLFEPLAQAKSLYLKLEALPGLWLRTDRIKLARVIHNLLGNAIKFTKEGGVALSVGLDREGVQILIADTGIGINESDSSRIFEEFTRLNPKELTAGWGLGLAISRRLVALMEGTVTAVPGAARGSVFTVWLPSSRIAKDPTQKAAVTTASTSAV